jgi:hypothetical protein
VIAGTTALTDLCLKGMLADVKMNIAASNEIKRGVFAFISESLFISTFISPKEINIINRVRFCEFNSHRS